MPGKRRRKPRPANVAAVAGRWTGGVTVGTVTARVVGTGTPTDYILVDDFDGGTLDADTWIVSYPWSNGNYDMWDHLHERYAVMRAEQVSLHDSYLDLHAHRQTTTSAAYPSLRPAWPVGYYPDGFPFRSGMVSTGFKQDGSDNLQKARWSYKYGRLKIRAYFPSNLGRPWSDATDPGSKIWPAIWLCADGTECEVYVPQKPEIDIIDLFGCTKFVQFSLQTEDGSLTLRYDDAWWGNWQYHVDFGDAWHVWELNWTPTTIQFIVDDVVWGERIDSGGYNIPQVPYFLMLNNEVGMEGTDEGGHFGPPDAPSTPDDHHFLIDWVRLYPYENTEVYRRGVKVYG